MQVSPAKQSYAWLPRNSDYRTYTWTDRQTPDKVIHRRHKNLYNGLICEYDILEIQNSEYKAELDMCFWNL